MSPPDNRGPGARLPAAILVGLDSMQGLQAARILRGHEVPVIGVVGDREHHACRTNTCERLLFADTGADGLVETLATLGPTLGAKGVLIPCQDKSVRIVSKHRDRLAAWFHTSLPAPNTLEMLMDKDAFYAHAMSRGLPVPATFDLRERGDVLQATRELRFPCLLKPAARTPDWDRNTRFKVFKITSAEELIARYDECRSWADSFVAQQWVEGDDSCLYSCNCYYDAASRLQATFVARKIRQWPPEAGSSCLGEEVRNDEVLDMTTSLFGALGYHGLGYLEVKRDSRTGEHFIIEPNVGRPTGRSAIAEAGGVSLLYTMYCDTAGLPLPENRTQRYTGAKWIDLRHDLQSAFTYWRRGQLTVMDWIRSLLGRKAYAVWSWRDPKPFFFDLGRTLRRALRIGLRR